jgi:predicted PurR-regulated permease PerM
VALAAALGLLVGLWLLFRPLLLIAAAVVLGEALAPLVQRLERRLPRLVAIPVAGALRVLILRVGAPAVRRWTGARTAVDGDASAREA